MGTSYNPKIITNGLILNLDAGNKKSYAGTGSNFYDIQKNKNIITLNNSPTFSSSNGGYLTFNGTTQYGLLSTPNLTSANYNKTILSWCRPATMTSNQFLGILGMGGRLTNVTPSESILLSINSTSSTYYISIAFWYNDYTSTAVPVMRDSWNLVGVIANSAAVTNNITIFCLNATGINFSTVTSQAYTRGLNTTITNLTIGCTDVPGRYFAGDISTALMYNRMLSQSEVITYYNATKGRFAL